MNEGTGLLLDGILVSVRGLLMPVFRITISFEDLAEVRQCQMIYDIADDQRRKDEQASDSGDEDEEDKISDSDEKHQGPDV